MPVLPSDLIQTMRRRADQQEAQRVLFEANIRKKLPDVVQTLQDHFGVTRAILFGSLAWGLFDINSDVDIAIDNISNENIGIAMAELSLMLGCSVELFELSTLPLSFRTRIETEGVTLL